MTNLVCLFLLISRILYKKYRLVGEGNVVFAHTIYY